MGNFVSATLSLNHLGVDLRIAAALLNKFFNRIVADKGREALVANAMLSRLDSLNFVSEIISKCSADELGVFTLIEDADFLFPRIEKDELPRINLGSYQLKQAKSYANAHKKARMTQFGVPYPCFVVSEDVVTRIFANIIHEAVITKPVLVFTRMNSRFRSQKSHESFILADADKNGPNAIIGHTCRCRHGLRTVGCCSHIATTIYFLCFARHHGGIRPVAGHVDNFFQYVSIENEDEEDDEEE